MSQTPPTPEDLTRDLAADLALCDAATPGPWEWRDGVHTADQRTSDAGGIHTRTPRPTPLPDGRCVPNDNVAFPVGRVGGDPYWVQRFTRAVACRPALTLALDLYALDADKHFLTEARTGWPAAIRRALAAEARAGALAAAIRRHRDCRGDDRCWRDDRELYAVLPEGYAPPPHDSAVELELCRRYIASRHDPATEYVSPQRRIEELEAECDRLRQALAAARDSGRVPPALESEGALPSPAATPSPTRRRIYLASSWRNTAQPALVEALRGAGHDCYDFRNPAPGCSGFAWRDISPDWLSWTPAQLRDALSHPVAVACFAHDWDALRRADTGVLLLPCGRSAHLEAGYFAGAGKDLFVLLAPGEPELMYRMAGVRNLCLTVPELLARLSRVPGDDPPAFACAECGLTGTAGDGLYCPACLRERCQG
jgi:hypothetical protein